MFPDPAECAINGLIAAMREAFRPDSPMPPLGGGSANVRFFAGEKMPIEYWEFHRAGQDPESPCSEPLLWVRLLRRYRTQSFPAPYVGPDGCAAQLAVVLEAGVGRCAAAVQEECDFDSIAAEAETGRDDSRRIEVALCQLTKWARKTAPGTDCITATAAADVQPYGPNGGVVGSIGIIYVAL